MKRNNRDFTVEKVVDFDPHSGFHPSSEHTGVNGTRIPKGEAWDLPSLSLGVSLDPAPLPSHDALGQRQVCQPTPR